MCDVNTVDITIAYFSPLVKVVAGIVTLIQVKVGCCILLTVVLLTIEVVGAQLALVL